MRPSLTPLQQIELIVARRKPVSSPLRRGLSISNRFESDLSARCRAIIGPNIQAVQLRRMSSTIPASVQQESQATGNASQSLEAAPSRGTPSQQPLVMQLIIDKSLLTSSGSTWTLGPMMAQASHAAVAVTAKTMASSALTREYVAEANLAAMHKVVLQTPSKGALSKLTALSQKLTEGREQWLAEHPDDDNGNQQEDDAFPEHYLWVEQPENIPTCLAIAPNRKPPVSAST